MALGCWVMMIFGLVYLEVVGSQKLDLLSPYEGDFGARRNHRQVRDCQPVEHQNVAHEVSQISNDNFSTTIRKFVRKSTKGCFINGHLVHVADPGQFVSVVEPLGGGCKAKSRSKVSETALKSGCHVAFNAGYFDTKTGQCHGNVVSDGKKCEDSGGIQNAHFGILRNGSVFIGYLPSESLANGSGDFLQLVGGVIWLVRDGKPFVNRSSFLECSQTQESGTFKRFIDVRSARTAIGHDSEGRVMVAHVNGWTDKYGIDLWNLADLMIEFGAVNAINLDGGGSSTFVVNGTVVNQVADDCADERFKCERAVTTIVCVKGLPDGETSGVPPQGAKEVKTKEDAHQTTGGTFSHTHAIILSMAAIILFSLVINIMLLTYLWKQKRSSSQPCHSVPNYSSLTDIMLASDSDSEN